MLLDLQDSSIHQAELDLGDEGPPDRVELMSTMDRLNQRYGKGTVLVASAGNTGNRRQWVMKQERRTPHYTTNWADVPVAQA